MPKRKLAKERSADESDLTPPPNDLTDGAVALAKVDGDSKQPVKKQKTVAAPKKRQVKKEAAEKETEVNGSAASPKVASRNRRVKTEQEETQAEDSKPAAPAKRQRKTKVVKEEEEEKEVKAGENSKPAEQKVKKKRKTKEEKEAEAMPLAARTAGHKLFIGAHVSSAGGQSIASIGIHKFIAKTTSPRRPERPPKQSPHRRKRLRPLPQVPAQMGQPTALV